MASIFLKTSTGKSLLFRKKLLPDEYQQVEYLQSTGTQYINTGVSLSSSINIKIKLAATTTNEDTCPFGVYAGGSLMYYLNVFNLKSYIRYGSVYYTDPDHIWSINRINTVEVIGGKWYLNGTQKYDGSASSFSYATAYFLLFKATASFWKGKIYSAEFYNNSGKLRNMIPCYRKSDSVAGMYDAINNVFYTNAGTGEFIVGPDMTTYVEPTYVKVRGLPKDIYQQVEYLQNTNSFFTIDIIGNHTDLFEFEYDIMWTYLGYGRNLCGFGGSYSEYWGRYYNATYELGGKSSGIPISGTERAVVNYKTRKEPIINQLYVNGSLAVEKTDLTQTIAGKQWEVFSIGKGSYSMQVKLYRLKVKINEIQVRDLIPCYRKADSTAGLYDVINDVFYTATSGTIIVGPDVN